MPAANSGEHTRLSPSCRLYPPGRSPLWDGVGAGSGCYASPARTFGVSLKQFFEFELFRLGSIRVSRVGFDVSPKRTFGVTILERST